MVGAGTVSRIVSSRAERSASAAGNGRDDGKCELVVTHGKVEEQLLHLGQHLFRPGILPVDLVDDEHGGEPAPERLGEHIARLREGSLGRVDEKHDAVHESQGSLDLSAEVRVPRCVDEVDEHVAPADAGSLCEDGDAALALLVVGVHDSVDHGLVRGKGARGLQEGIDEGRLAVVDVRDKGDVAEGVLHFLVFGGMTVRSVFVGLFVLVVVLVNPAVALRDLGVLVVLGLAGA
jgi:hypothetical protein